MNHEYLDKQPKQDIDYVIGYAPSESGYAVHGMIDKANSLKIYEDGQPVYANDDGVICKDQAALYDTLYD